VSDQYGVTDAACPISTRGGGLVTSLAFSRRCRTTSRVGELPASARSAKSSAAISVSGQSPCRSRICAQPGPARNEKNRLARSAWRV